MVEMFAILTSQYDHMLQHQSLAELQLRKISLTGRSYMVLAGVSMPFLHLSRAVVS
jgi:hypothetical protein